MKESRLYGTADFEKFYQLYLYVFNAPDESRRRQYFFERCQHGLVYGIQTDKKMTSALYSLPFQIDFHGRQFAMNGIGDVATAPESAGQGGAGKLLQSALDEMSINRVTLSYLAPFSYEYYRKFGYEQVFNHIKYTVKNTAVPRFTPQQHQGRVVRGKLAEHLPAVAQFYEKQAKKGLKGGLLREAWWWNYLPLKNNWSVGIYYDDYDLVQGYVIYELSTTELVVKELLVETTAAFEHLVKFIFNHQNTVEQLVFDAPDPRYHGNWLLDPVKVNVEVLPYMMVRVVDLYDFLHRYPYVKADFGPIIFGVVDQSLPQNSGVWEISATGGVVQVKQNLHQTVEPENQITIQELTKALFGSERLTNIVFSGKAHLKAETVSQLMEVLVNEPPELVDYF